MHGLSVNGQEIAGCNRAVTYPCFIESLLVVIEALFAFIGTVQCSFQEMVPVQGIPGVSDLQQKITVQIFICFNLQWPSRESLF